MDQTFYFTNNVRLSHSHQFQGHKELSRLDSDLVPGVTYPINAFPKTDVIPWRTEMSFVPVIVRARMMRENKEGAVKKYVYADYTPRPIERRKFGEREELVFVENTFEGKPGEGPYIPRMREIAKEKQVLRTPMVKKNLAYLIKHKLRYQIDLTNGEISRIWMEAGVDREFSRVVETMRKASKGEVFTKAAAVVAAEAGSNRVKVVNLKRELLASSRGRAALATAEGIAKTVIPQGNVQVRVDRRRPERERVVMNDLLDDLCEMLVTRFRLNLTRHDFRLVDVIQVIQLLRAKDATEILLCLTALYTCPLLGVFPTVYRHLVDYTSEFVAQLRSPPEPIIQQGLSDVHNMATRVRNAPLVVKTLTFLAKVVGQGLFGDGEEAGLFANSTALYLLKACTKGTDEVLMFMDLLYYWIDRFTIFSETLDVNDLFELAVENQILAKIEEHKNAVINLRGGDPDVRGVISRAKDCAIKNSKSPNRLVSVACLELLQLASEAARGLNVSRPMPVGLIVTGPPGTGKTTLADELDRYVRRLEGIPDDISTAHHHSTTKHQNLSTVVLTYVINDAFAVKEEKLEVGYVPLLQGLADTEPYRVEAASIEAKELSGISPRLIIVTTNNTKYTASTCTGGMDKLDRRYVIVNVEWNPTVKILKGRKSVFLVDLAPHEQVAYAKMREYDPEIFVFSMGRMENSPIGNVLNMEPKVNIFRTKKINKAQIFQYVKDEIAKNKVSHERERRVCEVCFMPCVPCMCTLMQQGAGMSIQTNVGFTDEASSLIKLAIGVVAMSTTLKLLLGLFKLYYEGMYPQGALVSTPNVVKEDIHVDSYVSTNTPWVGAQEARNVAYITFGNTGEAHGTFVTHNIFITSAHMMSKLRNGDRIVIKLFSAEYTEIYSSDHSVVFPDRDIVAYYSPSVQGIIAPFGERVTSKHGSMIGRFTLGKYTFHDPRYSSRGMYLYNADTQFGDCGLPLLSATGMLHGIHCGRLAAGGREAVSAAFGADELRYALSQFASRGNHVSVYSDRAPLAPAKLETQGNFGLHPNSDISKLIKFDAYNIHASGHTPMVHESRLEISKMTCKRTLIADYFPEAPLMDKPYAGTGKLLPDGTWRSPTIYRMLASVHHGYEDPGFVREAMRYMIDDLPIGQRSVPLDLYRAIAGDPRNTLYNPRDNSKSIGSTLRACGVTKANAYTMRDDGTWEVHPKVLSEYNRIMTEVYGEGPLTMDAVVATVKDEAYPIAKTTLAKGRLFYVGDHALGLAMRSLLLPLIYYLASHPLESSVNITMNAGSDQWKQLATYLESYSPEVFDGDHKEYDLRHKFLHSYYIEFMVKVAERIGYSYVDQRAVGRVLMKAARSALNLHGDWLVTMFAWYSGRTDTIVGNCVINKMLVYISRLKQGPLLFPALATVSPIRREIGLVATGDDLLLTKVPQSEFSLAAFARDVEQMGYQVTSSDKSASLGFKPLAEAGYLKRRFVWVGDRCYAPLEKDSIFKSLAYVTGIVDNLSEDVRNRSAASCALREMWMHGDDEFHSLRDRLSKIYPDVTWPASRDLGLEYSLGTFQTWRETTQKFSNEPDLDIDPVIVQQAGRPGLILEGSFIETLRSVSESREVCARKMRRREECPVHNTCMCNDGAHACISIAELNYKDSISNEVFEAPVTTIGTVAKDIESVGSGARGLRSKPTDTNLNDYLARPRLIYTFSSGTPANITPYDLWRALPAVADVVNRWDLFRGDLVLTFSYTGSSQAMGLFRMWAVPNRAVFGTYDAGSLNYSYGEPVTTSILPHLDIDYSTATAGSLRLKYPLVRTYMSAPPEYDWQLFGEEINALKFANGTTPPTITIDVYAHYENVELNVIVPQGKEYPEGQMSRALTYASQVAALIPIPWMAPVEKGLALGADIAKFFGWSRPPAEPQQAMVVRQWPNPALASGQPDFSFGFALDPAVQNSVAPDRIPLSEPGDTTFDYVSTKSSMLVTDWNIANSVNIAPGVLHESPPGIFHPSSLFFGSSMFEYWAGDITCCVQIVSSPLIRWRIGIAVIPPNIAVPLTWPGEGEFLTTIIDVVGSTCVDITIPYLHKQQFMDFIDLPVYAANVYQTRLQCYSLSAPLGPSETPVVPSINLWIKAGPKFSVGVPSLAMANNMILQGKGIGAESAYHFGEIVDDLLLLTRRMDPVLVVRRVDATDAFTFPVEPRIPAAAGVYNGATRVTSGFCFATYLATAYLGETGSYRHRLTSGKQITGTVWENVAFPGAADPGINPGYPEGRGGTSFAFSFANNSIDVRPPDRNYNIFRLTALVPIALTVTNSVCLHTSSLLAADEVMDWAGGADDYMIGGYLAPRPFAWRT